LKIFESVNIHLWNDFPLFIQRINWKVYQIDEERKMEA
jgi:hypothetical protein